MEKNTTIKNWNLKVNIIMIINGKENIISIFIPKKKQKMNMNIYMGRKMEKLLNIIKEEKLNLKENI